jgi:hypothetical protein
MEKEATDQEVACGPGVANEDTNHCAQMPGACFEGSNAAGESERMHTNDIQGQDDVAAARLKRFCANIIKALAPPLLREVETSNKMNADAEPFTPRRVTRGSVAAATPIPRGKPAKKATAAETVLLKALGITHTDLEVTEENLRAFKAMFDSPLCERQLRVMAAVFGKMVPPSFVDTEACQMEVLAH